MFLGNLCFKWTYRPNDKRFLSVLSSGLFRVEPLQAKKSEVDWYSDVKLPVLSAFLLWILSFSARRAFLENECTSSIAAISTNSVACLLCLTQFTLVFEAIEKVCWCIFEEAILLRRKIFKWSVGEHSLKLVNAQPCWESLLDELHIYTNSY